MNEKEKQAIKTIQWRKRILCLLAISLTLLLCNSQITNHLSIISNSLGVDCPLTNGDGLAINEKKHMEAPIDWGRTEWLGTTLLPIGSVIQILYTVLALSNSSVFFEPSKGHGSNALFDPLPNNLTLAPGESLAGTYTVISGTTSEHAYFAFYASVITENSSATVHWWYEVHKTGRLSTVGFLALSGALILLSLGVIVHSKRKTIKINR